MAEKENPETKLDETGGIEEVSSVAFKFTPVSEKPKRKYRKGSKYDPILVAFLKGSDKLSEVNVTGKDANYIRTQLNKRIEASPKRFSKIEVSVTNNILYLEKK